MRRDEQLAKLTESITLYEGVIRNFEYARTRMLKRRSGAIDSVMVEIDRSPELNQRTLDSLTRVLASAKEQLERAQTAGQVINHQRIVFA